MTADSEQAPIFTQTRQECKALARSRSTTCSSPMSKGGVRSISCGVDRPLPPAVGETGVSAPCRFPAFPRFPLFPVFAPLRVGVCAGGSSETASSKSPRCPTRQLTHHTHKTHAHVREMYTYTREGDPPDTGGEERGRGEDIKILSDRNGPDWHRH
jgi:hypothetical protein